MKTRIDEWITTVIFCGFIAVMSILFFLLPKQEVSETEKRNLQETPKYSWENLSSGQLGEDIESYMADHIPGRDFFVGVNAYTELLTGRQGTKDIYLASGDRLVERPVEWDQEQAERNMGAVNAFAESLGQEVDFMIVPSGGYAVRDTVKGVTQEYKDDEIINKLYAMAGEGVVTRDMASVFAAYEQPADLYYRTDHHWTSLGAYTAYAAYMEMLGQPAAAATDFTVETAEDFKGTTHSRSALWLVPGEPLEMWQGKGNISVKFGKNDTVYDSVFFKNRLAELDKYTVFLDGNHDLVTIENPDAPVDETILVVRDSYSNCYGPFLAQTYKKVVLVDLRYFSEAVIDYCGLNHVDRVLVLYSLSNFMSDTNLGRLFMTQNIHNLAPEILSDEKVQELAAYEGTFYELSGVYSAYCVKVIGDQYRASYLGNGSIAVLYFTSTGEKISGDVYKTNVMLDELSTVVVGASADSVKAVDPDGVYTENQSVHYTADGYVVTVNYQQGTVTQISTELI